MRRSLTSASAAALLMSVLALVVAVAAFVRAGDSGSGAALPPLPPVPTSEPAPGPSDDAPDESASAQPTPAADETEPAVERSGDVLQPQEEYPLARDSDRLRVARGSCGNSWSVDVDAMRVTQEDDAAEVQWGGCSGGQQLQLQTAEAAQVTSPAVTPQECQEAIRTSPTNAQLKPSKGLVLCLISDGVGDTAAAEQRHITRLVVDAVNDDLSLGLIVTTWRVG